MREIEIARRRRREGEHEDVREALCVRFRRALRAALVADDQMRHRAAHRVEGLREDKEIAQGRAH